MDSAFNFDITVTDIQVAHIIFHQPDKLSVNAAFNKISLAISSAYPQLDNIYLTGRFSIKISTQSLLQNMKNCPLIFSVRYFGNIIACGAQHWPREILEEIEADAVFILHHGCCEIKHDGVVGFINFTLRLRKTVTLESAIYHPCPSEGFVILLKDKEKLKTTCSNRRGSSDNSNTSGVKDESQIIEGINDVKPSHAHELPDKITNYL